MTFPASTQYPGTLVYPSGNPNWPSMTVAVEFTTGVWTDVTRFVRQTELSRGRAYETAASDAGTASFNLINTDGRFDPAYTSSPYYPNVQLRKRVRVQMTWSGSTKTLWQGYITRWPQTWGDGGNFQSTAMEATDVLGVLKAKKFGEHLAAEKILQLNPLYYWPLETTAATAPNQTPEVMQGSPNGTLLTFGGNTAVKAGGAAGLNGVFAGAIEGTSIAQFTPSQMGSLTPTNLGIINLMHVSNGQTLTLPPPPWTIGFLVQSDGKPVGGGSSVLLDIINSTGGRFIRLAVTSGGNFWSLANDSNGSINNSVWGTQLCDGQPHYLSLEMSGTGSGYPKMYWSLDGGGYGILDSGNPSGWVFNSLIDMNIGGIWPRQGATGVQGTQPWSGLIGHVGIFGSNLITNGTFSGGTSLPAVMVAGWNNDTSDQRIANLMNLAGRGAQFTSLGTGAAVLQPGKVGTKDAASCLQEIVPWESGNLFVNGSGNVVFSPRTYRYSPVSAYTLGGASTYAFVKVALDYDDQRVINQAIIDRDGGITVTQNNAASQAQYGLYSTQISTEEVRDDNQVLAQAQYLVRRYASPATRISAVQIDCAANPTAMFPFVMNTDIESCITVQHNPLAGTPQSQVSWIESVKYSISCDSFTVEHNLTPADTSQYLTIGSAAGASSALDNGSYALSF